MERRKIEPRHSADPDRQSDDTGGLDVAGISTQNRPAVHRSGEGSSSRTKRRARDRRMTLAAKLLHPSTLILIAANLLPLIGIFFWGWDAFLLLMLYWMETAIIGFWTILAIAIAPRETLGPGARATSRWFLVPFFIVHSGVFMGVHFLFLWSLFSGDWAASVHGPIEFIRRIVIATGLWIPLAALFISRGVSSLLMLFGPTILPSWR